MNKRKTEMMVQPTSRDFPLAWLFFYVCEVVRVASKSNSWFVYTPHARRVMMMMMMMTTMMFVLMVMSKKTTKIMMMMKMAIMMTMIMMATT